MKIAIVSDTHDNMANFKKAMDWMKKERISLILHCGDISSQATVDEAIKYFPGEIKFVKGNADFELDFPNKMEIEFNGKSIAFTHFPDIAKKLAQSGKYELVFYGHSHRAWDEKVPVLGKKGGDCHMINPGELAGQFYKPTFAVYDTGTKKLELKILEKI